MISPARLEELEALIQEGREHEFYLWPEWRNPHDGVRIQVLRLDRFECQVCKRKGRYSKATIVHHIKHLKRHPKLALSIYVGGQRQLESVCFDCHEDYHPERLPKASTPAEPLTPERWD